MPVCRDRWIVQHYLISWIGEQADGFVAKFWEEATQASASRSS